MQFTLLTTLANQHPPIIVGNRNKPLYCNVPDSLSESLARARLGMRLVLTVPFDLRTERSSLPFQKTFREHSRVVSRQCERCSTVVSHSQTLYQTLREAFGKGSGCARLVFHRMFQGERRCATIVFVNKPTLLSYGCLE